MAKSVFIDPALTLNSVNLVSRVRQATLSTSVNVVESSDVSTVDDSNLVGTQNFSLSIQFAQDTAVSNVEASLWAIYSGRASVPFTIKRGSGSTSVANPEYSGSVILTEIPFIDASRGDLDEVTVSFQGTAAITKATS